MLLGPNSLLLPHFQIVNQVNLTKRNVADTFMKYTCLLNN